MQHQPRLLSLQVPPLTVHSRKVQKFQDLVPLLLTLVVPLPLLLLHQGQPQLHQPLEVQHLMVLLKEKEKDLLPLQDQHPHLLLQALLVLVLLPLLLLPPDQLVLVQPVTLTLCSTDL